MVRRDKPLAWLQAEVKTPPISVEARREIGRLLRDLQQGRKLNMPESRHMQTIGVRCHEKKQT